MKVHIDPDLCNGTGQCADSCPEVFELDDEGFAATLTDEIPAKYQQACRRAVDNCPNNAILIEQ